WRPDVCVLDIGLPVMSGYELAVRLRAELGPDVTLIAVTGYTQDSDRERSRAAGYDLHLAKPVSVRELVAAMEERRARVDDEAVTR
ncbi:MAG: response regulator, partial [Sandaracinaceae bacterium]